MTITMTDIKLVYESDHRIWYEKEEYLKTWEL